MASTITGGKLIVKLSESIILNNKNHKSDNIFIVDSITNIYKRIVTIPGTLYIGKTTLVSFKSTVGIADGAMDIQNVKYIRVTNLDDEETCHINLQIDTGEDDSNADDTATIILQPRQNFIMGSPNNSVAVDSTDNGLPTPGSIANLESIIAWSGGGDADRTVEVFIASV